MPRDIKLFNAKVSDIEILCDTGFSLDSRKYYTRISELLGELIADGFTELEGAKRLADGGPTLISNRFAYPHISSYVLREKEKLIGS